MVINIKNPDIPATKKQLWLLHLLTGTDTRNSNLTTQQASDKISELKGNKSTNIKHKPINEKLAINPLDKTEYICKKCGLWFNKIPERKGDDR